MNITICGSILFIDKMISDKNALEDAGHTVMIPGFVARDKNGNAMSQEEFYRIRKSGAMEQTWFEHEKSRAMREHFEKIEKADAILVANYPKNGVDGYIGGNTLIEMGLALHLKKKIFLLSPIPDMPYTEELIGMQPIILIGDLSRIA